MYQKQENGRPASQERQDQSGKPSRDQRSEDRESGSQCGRKQ